MAVGGPVLGLLRVLVALAAAAPDPRGRHHVVHVEPDPDAAVAALVAERRHQERRRVDEVWREPDQQLALQQRLADQAEVEVLQVAEPAVDHLRRAAGGALAEVVALDQRDRIAARGRVEGHAGAGDPTADDDHVEAVLSHRRECLVARDHSRELHDLVGGRPLRRRLLLHRRAEVEQADETLVLGHADGRPALRRPQHLRSTPVARQPSAVGGEQDDVGGAGRGVQVLLVLNRIAGERRRSRPRGSARDRASWPTPGRRPA